MFLEMGRGHLYTPGMEEKRLRAHQILSPLVCLMRRNREREKKKPGHPINFYPRQESAGNTEWKVLAERVIFPVVFYSPRLTSVLPPLQPSRPTTSRWPPRLRFISDGLSMLQRVPQISKPQLVSQDSLSDGP